MFEKVEKLEKRCLELERLLSSSEVVTDRQVCNKYAKELADLREPVLLFRRYKGILTQIEQLDAVLKEKHEKDFLELAQTEINDLNSQKLRLEQELKESLAEEDRDLGLDIIVEIRPGTGGDEAGLFAGDLYRMYSQYALNKGWTIEPMAVNQTEAGGFKEIVFSVKGKDAYKRLKFESGVHRVQRVPVTEAQGRIHTSTATVAVLVEPKEVEMTMEQKDLRIDTYRSSGPGGQHMQKTDSAVRITHIPTGLAVACQDERSQIKNKNKAMRILSARLLDRKKEEEFKKFSAERRSQIGSGDRSEKIRTYNYPDRRVTDHRINLTLHKLEMVLNGDLEELSDALIKASSDVKNEAQ